MFNECRIPKIIHYCWFGGKEIPNVLKECMNTWKILIAKGYQIIQWDETNCSFDENDFVRQAYAEKRWGFVGDYYRAKALYDMGGIYLDTDVIIRRDFDELLDLEAFMGFSSDYALCTAVVGACKEPTFIKGILAMYENNEYISHKVILGLEKPHNDYKNGIWTPSNEFWGWNIIYRYPQFVLNNKRQDLGDLVIFPKQYFELGSLSGNYYCRHTNYNSWRDKQVSKNPFKRMKRYLEKSEKCWIVIRRMRSLMSQKHNNFYKWVVKKNKKFI